MPPSSSPPPPSPSPPPPAIAATGPSVGPGAIPGKICASSQPVLLVTGAARSGTSALAHLLHLQGAYAGELGSKQQSSDPRHPNIGSYELNALTRLLSAMLASRKQSWLACQELVVPNASDRRDAALLQAARSLAYRLFASLRGACAPILLKHPMLAPLLGWWAAALQPPSFAPPILLEAVRDPLATARSELTGSLWELHTVHEGGIFARWRRETALVLNHSAGAFRGRSLFVHYADWIATDRATQSLFAERLRARLAALGATGLTAAPDGRLAADIEAHAREADSFEAVPACLQRCGSARECQRNCSYPFPCAPGDPAPFRTAHSDQRCGRSIEPAELRLAALLRRLASNVTQPPAIWPAETCPPRTNASGAQL